MSRPTHQWPAKKQRAFTLVEIAIVVTIIGLLAALALPSYRKITLKSKATAAVNDLRIFSAAINGVNMQNAGWPAGGFGPGVIPPSLTNVLTTAYTQTTPIGGKYEWLYDTAVGKAAIRVANVSTDLDLIDMVDRLMDDGDRNSGSVQMAGPDLVYIIEK